MGAAVLAYGAGGGAVMPMKRRQCVCGGSAQLELTFTNIGRRFRVVCYRCRQRTYGDVAREAEDAWIQQQIIRQLEGTGGKS